MAWRTVVSLWLVCWMTPGISAGTVHVRQAGGCMSGGKVYPEGQRFKVEPCLHCQCVNGSVACVGTPCYVVDCVDSVQGDCCRVCPNGSNCRAPDGSIMPADTDILFEHGTMTCRCAYPRANTGNDQYHFFSYEALCRPVSHTAH